MDMLQVFHMNKGEGEGSYAKNCTVQDKMISITKPFVVEAIQDYYGTDFPETMSIADFGCSSGPTALKAVSEVMDVIKARCREIDGKFPPMFMVFLNDLPGNDFNRLFASVSSFHKQLKEEYDEDFGHCFIAGLPGTFYGRLLPNNTLHFVHSSSSLHWLSQVPSGLDGKDNPKMVNKGKIYLSITSPKEVISAYKLQFQKDFLSFLRSRSHEVIKGGRMVLTLMGRRSSDPTSEEGCYPWEFIAQSLMTMVSEGLIEEEEVDSFNVPFYAPCIEEVNQLIEGESSFNKDRLEALEVNWDASNKIRYGEFVSCNTPSRGEMLAKMHRAVIESLLEHHFGGEIMDVAFYRYSKILDHELISNPNAKFITLVVSLIRK